MQGALVSRLPSDAPFSETVRSVATSKAMLDAVTRLVMEQEACCLFSNLITGEDGSISQIELNQEAVASDVDSNMNASQLEAVRVSLSHPMSLIWGPPG